MRTHLEEIEKYRGLLITADSMLTDMFEAGFDLNPVGTSIPYHFVQHLKTLGFHNINEFAITSEQFLPYLDEHLEKKLIPLLFEPAEAVGRRPTSSSWPRPLKEYIGTRALRDTEARLAQPPS